MKDMTAPDINVYKFKKRAFGVSQWYQWYTNIVQCFTNGTIGNTICTNGNANGTIGSPNGTIGAIGKPMVPLVSPERSQRYWYNVYLLKFNSQNKYSHLKLIILDCIGTFYSPKGIKSNSLEFRHI